ncbi:398_t:CDS:2 [Rhizophagus irregularis]|nr:398_t:CDS:2 [Rhizophagus irregularis]
MGLPMYVSPSISKRQLPSKQPTSPPYTPQAEESFDETFQNARTSVFDIPESQTESTQRSQRSRRSSSLPYTLVQQHIHRLHQLHQLHRTREQQHISTNLASRRGLNSAHHLSLNHRTQIQQLQQMQAAAQARRENNVIRRVNLLRQISQQQEMRSMRSSSRHHRSSTGHSSGRSSRMTSQNTNVDRRRDDLIQRGIDMPSSRHHQIPDSNLLYEHSVPFPPMQRLSAWHTRRGVNWSAVDPPPVQRTERRSSFTDDFYSEIPHQYDSDDHHLSRIISPIPRSNNDSIGTEPRGSASGEVC